MTEAKNDASVLDALYQVVQSRKGADPESSYTARLYAAGSNKIAQKVGEEAVETVIAAVAEDRDSLIMESADLLYHLTVLWSDQGLDPSEIYGELARRHGAMSQETSGDD